MKQLKSGLLVMVFTFLYPPYCYPMVDEPCNFKADIVRVDDGVQAICKGKEIIIKRKAGSDVIELRQYSRTEDNEQCKILYQIPTEKMVAVVLDVTGSSRQPQGLGFCGAGDEAAIIWIGISKRSNDYSIQSFPYSSCLFSIGASECKQDANGLQVTVEDFHNHKVKQMRFLTDQPEKGLIITEHPLAEPASPTVK